MPELAGADTGPTLPFGARMSRWAVWRCPQCHYEERQLAAALAVGHRCKQVRQVVELQREPEGPENGALSPQTSTS